MKSPNQSLITRIIDLESKWPLWKQYMADNTNLDGHKLKAALHEFAEVGLLWRKQMLKVTPTKKMNLLHVGMYIIARTLFLLLVMMCRSRRRQGSNLGSQVVADKCALRHLDRFPSWTSKLYHRLCGFRHCWAEGKWNQYSAILMALAWGWWIETSHSFINCRYDHFVNREWFNRRSARPQPENPRAMGLPGGP